MKKIILIILIMLITISPFCFNAYADDTYNNQMNSFYEESGADSLMGVLPDDVNETVNSYFDGFSQYDVSSALSFNRVINFLLTLVTASLKSEMPLLITIIVTLIIGMIFEVLYESYVNKSLAGVSNIVQMTAIIIALSASVTAAINITKDSIYQMSLFCNTLSPVVCTMLTSGGEPAKAAVAGTSIMLACQICSYIGASVVLPIVNMYFAVVICDSIVDNANLKSFAEFIKKTLYMILLALIIIFSGIMSLQTVLAGTADTVLKRSIKFAVGGMIPIAGGPLGEAMETVFSCADAVGSTVGIFGIIVILFIITTPIVMVLSKYVIIKLAAFTSYAVSNSKISGLLSSMTGIFGVLASLTMASSIMLISSISVTVILMKG